jgi:diguanylate cyclase (GGDEF)-like protein/PAS domain S-box-containing protein
MVVVFGLGAAGMAIVTRRGRSATTQAYEAVGERCTAQEALRANEGRFQSLVRRACDLTVVTDEFGIFRYVGPAAEALLGYPPEDLLGLPLLNQVEAGERAQVGRAMELLAANPGSVHTIELRWCTRDGRVRLVEAVCQNLVEDPDVGGLVWNGRDVTDRRAFEDELSRQALHDPLTGLPNRMLLLNRLTEALRSEPGSESSVSVILVDLDGFKNVNDALGHPAGDELLRIAAQRLLGCVREGDTAARLGGDEFAVLAGHSPHAVAVGRRIVDILSQPFTLAGQEVRVSASIGIAHHQGSEAAEDLLRDADIAMYVAKNRGSGRVEVFEPAMGVRALRRISLQQQVARAVDLGEIEVHYQPIIDLKTSRPTTLEALARWRRPDRSLVPADVFIPIAEQTGAIIEIGREVLRQACHAVQMWRRTVPGHSDLGVAVNVSAHQVLSGRLVEHVAEALGDSGMPPSALTLEITESTALEDPDRVAAEFALLRRLGVRIAVDDFGSGYSSLGMLMRLTVDVLKIDSTLLDFDTTRQGSLVTAVAELGRTLGLTVVVEGVETPDHLARAFEAACDAAQGYHFSRPLAFEDVPGFFDGWSDKD